MSGALAIVAVVGWDKFAPYLANPAERQGAWWMRPWFVYGEQRIQQRLNEERVIAWARIAPGGTPLWLMPDEDLESMLDSMASSSRARTVEVTYVLDELDRRRQARLTESTETATRRLLLLTWVLVLLTVAILALTVVMALG